MDKLFSDEEISALSGLHIDTIRKAVVYGAVKPAQGGRGRNNRRMWSAHSLLRLCPLASIKGAGLSLPMAHTISFLAPFRHELFVFDPRWFALNDVSDIEGWWDPDQPRVQESPRDFFMSIVNGRWIFFDHVLGYNTYFADGSPARTRQHLQAQISPDGTKLLVPSDWSRAIESYNEDGTVEYKAWWESVFHEDDHIRPEFLVWEYDEALDVSAAVDTAGLVPLARYDDAASVNFRLDALADRSVQAKIDALEMPKYREAMDALSRPASLIRLNISLPIRIAMRRAMGLHVDYPGMVG